ncbi:MAG: type II toxin-antitoxin system RelE family toxin [Luteolibacter sp.]
MSWDYQFDARALREFKKLGQSDQERLLRYLKERVIASGNPQAFGKPLRQELAGLWRYRIGDFRMICQIQDEKLVILVVRVGHRRDIYD